MQAPQVVVFEPDGRLVAQVRPLVEARRWLPREAKTPDAVLKLLARGGPTVLLLRIGRDLERELGLLERATWLYPAAAVIVVGDSDHAVLAGLAWDLGARAVLIPAPEREGLQEIVAGLMQSEEAGRADLAPSR
jgi:hypothetical protein